MPTILFPTTISKKRKDKVLYREVVSKGEITDWEDIRAVLVYCYKQLQVKPQDYPVLISERTGAQSSHRQRLSQILFEEFKVPAISFQYESVLALYAAARMTGLVVDCGHGVTTIVPVVNGFEVERAVMRSDVAGAEVTDLMMKVISDGKRTFSTSNDRRIVNELKEMFAFLKVPGKDSETYCEREDELFELSDGFELKLTAEQCSMPGEVLFDPSRYLEREGKGLHQMIVDAVDKCDIDHRRELLANIVITGGTTLMEGFAERLDHELRGVLPITSRVNIIAEDERDYSVWIGGSVLSGLEAFHETWVFSEEFLSVDDAALFDRRRSSAALRRNLK